MLLNQSRQHLDRLREVAVCKNEEAGLLQLLQAGRHRYLSVRRHKSIDLTGFARPLEAEAAAIAESHDPKVLDAWPPPPSNSSRRLAKQPH